MFFERQENNTLENLSKPSTSSSNSAEPDNLFSLQPIITKLSDLTFKNSVAPSTREPLFSSEIQSNNQPTSNTESLITPPTSASLTSSRSFINKIISYSDPTVTSSAFLSFLNASAPSTPPLNSNILPLQVANKSTKNKTIVTKNVTKNKNKCLKRLIGKSRNVNLNKTKITRSVSSYLQEVNTTRNRYYLSGGSPLKWIKSKEEFDRPLTKEGSLRFQRELMICH